MGGWRESGGLSLALVLLCLLSATAQDDSSSDDDLTNEALPGDIDAGDAGAMQGGVEHTVLWVDQYVLPQETKFYMLPRCRPFRSILSRSRPMSYVRMN